MLLSAMSQYPPGGLKGVQEAAARWAARRWRPWGRGAARPPSGRPATLLVLLQVQPQRTHQDSQ